MPTIYVATIHFTSAVADEPNENKWWMIDDTITIKCETDNEMDADDFEVTAHKLIKQKIEKSYGKNCDIWFIDVDVYDIETC